MKQRKNTISLLLAAACFITSAGMARALQVNLTAATGGSAISADTAAGSWTTLTGPVATESGGAGLIGTGTIILTAPTGFQFNPGASVKVMVNGGSTAANNINGTANGGTFSPTSVTVSAITINITSASSVTPNTLTWQGIQVQPTAGTPLASAGLSESGTSSITAPNGTWGTLAEVAGAATELAFTTQPGGGTGGAAWTTQPVVTVQDQFGNTVTTDTSTVTLGIANNAGGGTLNGMLTETAVAGVAAFSGLSIDKIGTGYTLMATDGSLTSATSNPFNITMVISSGVAPAGWYAGDIHVHRDCGGSPTNVASLYNDMVNADMAVMSLLADMGNGEVQDATTDLPLVNGQDASVSTAGRIVHWDAEWHWDADYTQYPHQALGGHIVALGLTNAYQIWCEPTYPIFDWAHQQGAIGGFAHFEYLDDSFPTNLTCCTPIEYPVEVALGNCDFISEDVTGSDYFIHAYYRLLNCGFRPGFAAGSDWPCGLQNLSAASPGIGPMLTYSQVAGGQLTYRNWIQAIAAGRTVISRNGLNEFVSLVVNGTATPGDEIQLSTAGSVPVTVTWTAQTSLTGTLELVCNGVVVASQQATAGPGSPVTFSTTVNFPNSGWLCARRMDPNAGHEVHTAAVFVTVNGAPVRASASDAQFYVQWMENMLTNIAPGGVWNSFFPTTLATVQARYQTALNIYQQIAADPALAINTSSLPNGFANALYFASLTAVGGTTPYTCSIVNGALPPGLTLDPGSGDITGTPTTTGVFNFLASVSDSSDPVQTATQPLSITITNIYGNGPGGPILVLANTANPFSTYYAEILLAEGLNEFALEDITSVDSGTLANYDVILLGETVLTSGQVTMLNNWVNAGGSLIAMRPDKQLAGLLGLTDALGTITNAYLLVNTSSGPGVGIVGQTIQFHGVADQYTLNGATSLATLYSTAQTSTGNPAVTLRSVGSGQAAAFTFDLARSIVLTRQGNPAWSGQLREAQVNTNGEGQMTPIRAVDLFYGAASYDPEPDWVDLNNVAIPQADEEQRLLANMILSMHSARSPLPRFWYFPHGYKAAVVMTGDDHAGDYGGSYASTRFDAYLAASPPGGSVDDWTVPRCTANIFVSPSPCLTNDAQAAAYNAAGFEIGLHLNTGCADYTGSQLDGFFTDQMGQFIGMFPSLPAQTTHRIHCIAWSDYSTAASVSYAHGIRLDTSYYYWPPAWVNNQPGFFTGSGMPMRFADTNGDIMDIYQATTQMTDESGQTYPYTVDTLLNGALGAAGYYGAFVANMHTDTYPEPDADAIFSSATNHGVPIISARQLLTWVDARNASSFQSIVWDSSNTRETFSVQASPSAWGLQAMLPVPAGYIVGGVLSNGNAITYSYASVKGLEYVMFEAGTGDYAVSFAADTTPPTVSQVFPANGATDVSGSTNVTVTFSEAMNASTITTNTITLWDAKNNAVAATVSYNPTNFTAILQPNVPLGQLEAYTAKVVGGATGVKDIAGNPLASQFAWTFTTSDGIEYHIWSDATVPTNPTYDPHDLNSYEFGVEFKSDVDGYVTGVRFYKGPNNTGTHIGNLWTTGGQNLASATFTGETAEGWQSVSFATPVAITAGTIYVASYFDPNGGYSADVSGDAGFLGTAGVDNPPLHAPVNSQATPNGVLVSSPSSAFPASSANGVNWWVDVSFVQTLPPPAVIAVSPTNGAVGVSLGTVVAVTFSEAMNPATITSGTITMTNSSGGLVGSTVAYYGSTNTAILTPNSPLAPATLYTVVVANGAGGVTDVAGNALANVFTASFTTQLPDTNGPTVIAVSPTNGAVGVSLGTVVAVTFSKAMNPATITNGTITMTNSSGGLVGSTVAYYGSTNTAILSPSSPLALSTLYTVVVANGAGGVTDVAGNALTNVFTASFTTTDQAIYTIWPASATPGTLEAADANAIEVGVKFRSDINGYVTGVRFYKGGTANGGTHIGNLWTTNGVNLASATFTGETASGWQEVDFATPVPITANTVYIASYFAPMGMYSADGGYFVKSGVDSPPLHALANGVDGGNGVYSYGSSSTFPTNSYNSANYWVDVVFEQPALTVTADSGQTKVYGQPDPTLTYQASGFLGSDTAESVLTGTLGRAVGENVGSYAINQGTLSAGGKYTIQFVSADFAITAATVTPTVTLNNMVYNGTTGPATINTRSLSGVVGSDDVSLGTSGTVAAFSSKNVNSYTSISITGLSLSGTTAGNYALSSTSTTASASITAATVTPTVTLNNLVYNGTTGPATINTRSLGGVVSGDDVSLGTSGTVAAFSSKNVNSYSGISITGLSLSGTTAGNYALSSTSTTASASIMAATVTPTVTLNNLVYNGTTGPATINTRSLGGVVSGDDVSLGTSGTVAAFSSKNVSSYTGISITGLSLSGTTAGNYALSSTSTTASASITAATVTPTVTLNNLVYNGTTGPASINTRSLSGVVSGDDVSLGTSGTVAAFSSKNVNSYTGISITGLSLSGTTADNYELSTTSLSVSASITALPLTVTAHANSKTYDGGTSAATAPDITSGAVQTGDTANFSETYDTKNVGTGKTLTPAGSVSDGNGGNNYSYTFQTASTGTITVKGLTVTGITASNKAYDGTTTATLNAASAAMVGTVAGDDVTLNTTGAAGAFADADVGTNKTVQVSGLTISGADATNYLLAQPTTTASITASSLTVTGIVAQNKVYDGTTNATLNVSNAVLVGVVSGDAVTLNTSNAVGVFADKNVGTNKNVTVTGLTISGAAATNYTLTQPTLTADITPAGLLVTGITASNKVYDATTMAALNTSNAALVRVPPLPARPGDIGFSFLSETNTTANTTSYMSTPAFQVGSNCLALAAIVNSDSSLTPTNFSGNGLNWQRILSTNFSTLTTPTRSLTVYAAMSNNISALGRGTVQFSATQSGCNIYICEFTNVWYANGMMGAVVQMSARAANSSVNPSNVLSALASGGQNAVVAFFGGASNPFNGTPPTGWTEDVNMGYNTPPTGLGAYHRLQTTNNILVLTRSASDWASAMMELRSLNDGPPQGPLGGDDVTLVTAGATGTFTDANAGAGKTVQIAGLTISGTDAANYSLTQPTTTADITPAPLTVTATDTNKVYGSTLSFAGTEYMLTGTIFDGDTLTNVTLASAGAPGTAPAGSYAITPSAAQGAGLSNYTISYTNGTLTVDPKAAAVAANPKSKTYGDANPALDAAVTGTVNGDTLDYTLATTAAQFSPVGGYPITVTVGVNPNYTVTPTDNALTVGPKAAAVAANPKSKTYGQANPALDATVTGTVNGDTLNYTLATTAVQFSPVAGYPITVTLGVNPNYTLTPTDSTLTISEAALTVVAADANRAYGQTNPVFTATYIGFVNGETNDVLGGALVFTCSADTNSPVGTYAIEPSGLTAANYSITFSNGTLTVKPYALTVTADDKDKIYGETDPAFTVSYSGFVDGQDASVLEGTLAISRAAGEDVGGYAITPSGLSSTNYAITYAAGTLTIKPAGLTITADNQSKGYGAVLPGLTVSYSGFVNGDTAASLTAAPTVATTGTASSPAGSYPITASGAVDGNYTIGYVAGTLTVNPVGLTITADNQSKGYGAVLPGLTVSYSGFVNGDTAASLTAAPTVATTGTASSPAGSYPITASGAVDANYTIGYVAGTLTVNPVGLTITADNQSKGYGAVLPGLTVSYSGFVNGDTAASLTAAPTVATTGTASSPVGNYPITASGAVDGNYTIGYVAGTLAVNPVGLTITAKDQSKAYGAALPGLMVSYSGFVNGDTAASLTVAPTVTTTGTASSPAGSYPITASGAVDGNYTISYVAGTLTVSPVPLAVTANDASRAYGQTNPVFTATYIGFVNGETNDVLGGALVFTCSADTNSPVGTYAIEPSGLTAANYSITFSNGTLTVKPYALTVTADDKDKIYGETDPAFTVSYSGFVDGQDASVLEGTLAISRAAGEDVGGYAITPSGLSSTNYAITYAAGTLTIKPAGLTITADNQSKGYGAVLPGLTVSYSGFVNGDTAASLTAAPTVATTGTASSPAGSYPITASGAVDANYTIGYVAGTLTVNPVGLTITADNQSKGYGAVLPGLTVSYSGFVNGDTAASLTVAPTVTTTGTASSPAGSYPITASGAVDANYTIGYVAGTLTVNPVGLTITADNQSKGYGAVLPGLTVSYSGFVNGDTAASLTAAPTVATTGTASSPVGNYPITASGAVDGNYTIGYVAGTLAVNPVGLTITAKDQSKAYGAALPGLTVSYSGFVNGDTAASLTVAPTVTTTGTASSPAGSYPITASGAVDGNYTISYVAGTLTVSPVPLAVTANDASRAYGQTNPVFTATYIGFVNGETNDVLGGALVFTCSADTNSPVGTYAIEPSGLTAANYSITFSNGTLTVKPYALTVTADDKDKIYGETDPAFTVSYSGFVDGQDASVLEGTLAISRAAGEDVGGYAITPSGLSSTNYAITYAAGTLTIKPAGLTITADNQSKGYGAVLPGLTVSYSGFVNGDTAASLTAAPTVATTGTASSPAGSYPITASGAVDANYTIGYVAGTLTVNPVGLTITADNQSKGYGAVLPGLTVSYSGFVNGDTAASLTVAPTVTTTGTASSPAGSYPITASGAVDANYTIGYVAGTLTVNPVGLTITADNQSKGYGAVLPGLTVSYSGFVNGDTAASLTAAPTVATTGTASSPVGNYPITASGAVDGNYTIGYVAGTLAVNPVGLTITAKDQSKAYGAALPGLTVSYSGFVNGDTAASLTVAPTVTTTGTASSPAGSYPITASGAVDGNYTISYVAGTLTVSPVPLAVTANDASRAYGQTNPVFTATYIGFVNRETNDVLGGALVFTCSADTNSPVGTYAIEPSGLTAANYSITFSNGTLTVKPYALTVTADDKDKIYGETDPAFTVSYSGFVDGQDASVLEGTLAISRAAGEDVGGYAITPSGLSSTNYAITYAAGTLTIKPAGLTITADNQSKGYGAVLPGLTVSYSGFVNGDTAASLTAAPTVATTGTASSPAGSYPITASGAVDGNYTIGYVAGTLTVNPVGLTITADNQSKGYGAVLPGLTVSYSGFVNGDTAASLTVAPTVATTGTASSPAGSYPITASGAVDANYTIGYVAGTLTVNPVGLTITADNQSKGYGAVLPGLTVSYSGFVNGDTAASLTAAPTVATTGTASSPVGNYPITASGAVDGNYTIGYVAGTLAVNPVGLTITAKDQSKAYGAALPGLMVSYSGFVNGDTAASLTVAPTVTTTGTASSPAGSYPITASGAVDANYTISYVAGTLTITQANSATALISSANPSLRGSNVTFTTTVAPVAPASTTPTGNVQFYTNGVALGSPVALTDGVAALSTADLPPGTNTVLAAYVGDSNFLGSTGGVAQVVSVVQTPVTVGITNNGDGSVTITFSGTPGAQYIVQASGNLGSPGAWTNVSTNIAGTGGHWTFTDSTADYPIRFYRAKAP